MQLGDKVTIKECHKIPDTVGKEATVVAMALPEYSKYPIQVMLTEPISLETPFGNAETKGPFVYREDELEVVAPDHGIPDVFKED